MHVFTCCRRSDDRDARIKTRDREVLARYISAHLVLVVCAQVIAQCFIENICQFFISDLVLSAIIGDAEEPSS